MNNKALLTRITVNPKVLIGKPTIRGLRISVEQLLKALAAGVPADDLLQDYPELEPEDIQALLFTLIKFRRHADQKHTRINSVSF